MSEGNTTRISAEEALRRIERGESLTDWARVRALSDAEIEPAAAQDPDCPEKGSIPKKVPGTFYPSWTVTGGFGAILAAK